MPNEIYNEGRVVGYSAYELFVKTYLSEGGDPTKVPTEREWLASSIGMGSSMIVKVSGESVLAPGHIDIPFPSNSKLLAANIIIGSFFDGDAVFDGAWATKVTDYGTGVNNANTTSAYPSGNYDQNYFWQLPFSSYSTEDASSVSIRTKRLQNYLRITDGVVLMPGQWVHTTGNTPPSDLHPNLNEYPVLRLRVENDGTFENFPTNTEPRILLTGFTIGGVVQGLVGVDGSTDTSSNIPQDGGFNGPAIFPWASKVILTVPNSYMRKYGISYRAIGGDVEDPFRVSKNSAFIDIDANLNTVYGSTSNSIYTPYTYSTPSRASGVAVVYNYFSTPTKDASTFVVYQKDSNYPPALYANVVGRVVESSYDTEYLYPVDIVAPGTVKVFKNGNNTMMKTFETTFTGTTALNLSSSGILSMTGSSNLFNLNNIVSGNAAVTVNHSTTTGDWSISVDATGQINVVTDSNTSSIKITPSTSSGVKTFTVSQTIQKKPQTTGIEVTSSNGVVNIENTMKLKAGIGISVSPDGNGEYTITNTRPVISNGDMTGLGYQYYRVYYPTGSKYLKKRNSSDPGNTWITRPGYGSGVTRGSGTGYSWKTTVLNGSYGDTAHREKLPMGYMASFSGNNPTAVTLSFGEKTSIDAGDPNTTPSAYNSSSTYYRYDYCTYDGAKWRCLASETTGDFNTRHWRQVTAVVIPYSTSTSYIPGDYCLYRTSSSNPYKQYTCIQSTSGAFDGDCWLEDSTIYPQIEYQFSVIDALSSNRDDPTTTDTYIPYCGSLRYTHGVATTRTYGESVDGVSYDYYPWDLGLVARFALTPEACKKIFLGDENIQFNSNSYVLIDGANSGAGSALVNWGAFTGISPSSPASSSTYRLSYPVNYRVTCRYPFIVYQGQVKTASWSNIQDVNNGWLADNFQSAVSYKFERDVNGLELSDTNDYHNFAMIFDITMESVSDGMNNQIINVINYEGKPEPPYVIACAGVHMALTINPRILTIQNVN